MRTADRQGGFCVYARLENVAEELPDDDAAERLPTPVRVGTAHCNAELCREGAGRITKKPRPVLEAGQGSDQVLAATFGIPLETSGPHLVGVCAAVPVAVGLGRFPRPQERRALVSVKNILAELAGRFEALVSRSGGEQRTGFAAEAPSEIDWCDRLTDLPGRPPPE